MKWYRGGDGGQRFWLESGEIESMMEDELRRADLFPSLDSPVVDMEAFIERHLQAKLDQHADLDSDVLGLTEFYPGQPPRILINRDLTGAAIDEDESPPGVLGRWRATLAHEGAHVVEHRSLFELDDLQGDLFPRMDKRAEPQRLMRCFKKNVLYRDGGSDWREVQANRGMAALLMPRSVFLSAVEEELARLALSPDSLAGGSLEARRLAARLATFFAVSKQAAEIRLQNLGVIRTAGQGLLAAAR